jgi:streptogramin lyase
MHREAPPARHRSPRPSRERGRRIAICCAAGVFLVAGLIRAQPIEYPLPVLGFPAGIVTGPDGAVWFTDQPGKVSRITTSGSITSFPVSGGVGQSASITVGSDGNLWFAGNGISRMTTSGTVTTFVPPTANSSPQAIVSGPDGALWFTESAVNQIGRVTTAGVFTEYPIPTVSANPFGIAVGSDGALWFTEEANKIGRITTAGSITEFPIAGDMSGGGSAIAAGPDGNLWFTENPGNKIGRITTAGALTEFPLATTTRAFGISPGSDGNVWFTEFDGDRIGRITPSGVVTEYFIPTAASGPYIITSGPDGNLWFTEFNASKIGRVNPPTPPPAALFYTVTPCRVVDTRNATGPLGGPALAANATRLFSVTGVCGVPATARALVANVAVTGGTSAGHLSLYPGGSSLPLVSTINYSAGQTRANNAILELGSGTLQVRCGQGSGTIHLILDVSGYFQ